MKSSKKPKAAIPTTETKTDGAVVATSTGIRISVHAQPGAKRTELSGLHGEAIKIRVQSPPVDGKANDELIRFLASQLGVPRSNVTLHRGEKSRSKAFDIINVTVEQALSTLLVSAK